MSRKLYLKHKCSIVANTKINPSFKFETKLTTINMKTQTILVLSFIVFCIVGIAYCFYPIKVIWCIWSGVGTIYLLIVIKYEKHERTIKNQNANQ